jgi:hypothetical protein
MKTDDHVLQTQTAELRSGDSRYDAIASRSSGSSNAEMDMAKEYEKKRSFCFRFVYK